MLKITGDHAEEVMSRIKTATNSTNLTDIADAVGVSPANVYRVQADKRVPLAWITQLALQYNISPHWIVYGKGLIRIKGTSKQPVTTDKTNEALVAELYKRMCK